MKLYMCGHHQIKVISVDRGMPFEKAFGVDYQKALGDCIEELENHYER